MSDVMGRARTQGLPLPVEKRAQVAKEYFKRAPLWRQLSVALGGAFLSSVAVAATIPDILVNQDGLYGSLADISGPAGGTFTYRAKVKHNAGPTAKGVVLTEELPIGAIFQSYSSAPKGISCTPILKKGTVLTALNNTLTCKVGTLSADDGFKSVDFNVILPTVSTGWLAKASASMPALGGVIDGDGGINNVNLARNFTTIDAADMAVTLTAVGTNAGEVNNGDKYSYEINTSNVGPSDVPPGGKVQVTFEVPAGAPVQSTPTGAGWSCRPTGYQSSGVITCDYAVPLGSAGLSAGSPLPTITVPVQSSMGGPIGAAVSVEAFSDAALLTPLPDGQKANNTDSLIVKSTGDDYSDMSLTKTVDKSLADAKEGAVTKLIYSLTAKRVEGGLTPRDITIVDQLPDDVELTSFATSNDVRWLCSYDALAKTITCVWAGEYTGGINSTMPVIKYHAEITAPKNALQAGARVNKAVLSMPKEVPEPNTTNNDATTPVTFNNTSQLQLSKVLPDSRPVKKGEPFTYVLTVSNDGPMDVLPGQTITLTDTPTAPIELTGFSDSAIWACPGLPAAAGAASTCTTTAGLKVGQQLTLTYTAIVNTLTGEYATWNNSATAGVNPGDRGGETISANTAVTVSDRTADLVVGKTLVSPNPGPAKSGDLVTYQITVTNDGLSTQDAQSVVMTDELHDLVIASDDVAPATAAVPNPAVPYPDGGFISAKTVGTVPAGAGAVTCAVSNDANSRNRTLTCPVDLLKPGESVTVEVQIRPRVNASGTYSNTASAYSSFINDSNLTNNSASADVQVTSLVDIGVVKQVSPTVSVAAGEPATYTVTTQNYGPSHAAGVTMVDTLPANAYLIGEPWGIGSGGSCRFADANGQPVAKGDGLLGGTMTCSWPNPLPDHTNFVVQYKARSVGDDPAPGATMNNAVRVDTTTPETRYDNNDDARSIALKPAEVDVMIDMRHTADGLALGEKTTYTITVQNSAGASYASLVNMTDVFPAAGSNATFSYQGGLTFKVNGSAVQGVNASMCKQPAIGETAGQLQCVFPLMAPGDKIEISFDMVAESLPAGATTGTIFHAATVKPYETEYLVSGADVAKNNGTTDRTSTSKAAIDLGIDKAGPASGISEGDTITYTLTVTNHGKSGTMSPVGTVTDILPKGLIYVSASGGNGCTFNSTSRELSCVVPSILSGSSTVFTVQTKVEQPYSGARPLVNKAKVTVPGDANPDNDEDETTTTIEPPPTVDYGIHKAGPTDTLNAGDSAVYTITVTNAGKGGKPYTTGAKMTDVLPDGLEYVSATGGDGCTFATATRTVSCDVPAMDASATTVFTVSTKLANPYTGARPLVNKASVALPGDENPKNDEDETTTPIVPPAEAMAVPTLSEWSLVILSAILAVMGLGRQRRQQRAQKD